MSKEKGLALSVSTKKPDSRWVAISSDDRLLSEGKEPSVVLNEAQKNTSENVFLMFIPKEGTTYIF